MTTQTTALTPSDLSNGVRTALAAIEIEPDGLSGRVAGRDIDADTRRELENHVTVALYDVLHAGQEMNVAQHPSRLRDHEFEARLYDCVRAHTTSVTGTVCAPAIASRAEAGSILVDRQGIRIWLSRDSVVPLESDVVNSDGAALAPGTPVRFDVASARPALSPGFFVYDSPRVLDLSGPALRLYIHVTNPDEAVTVWRRVSESARGTGINFRMKVLSSPTLYPRRDAVVVYASITDAQVLADIAGSLDGVTGIGDETSLFAHRVGSGRSLACEPADPDPARAGLSFGQHRAAVIADAVLTARDEGIDTEIVVAQKMWAANIDPVRPHLNADSTVELPA